MMAPERICREARKQAKRDAGTSCEPADADYRQIRPALRVAARGAPAASASLADDRASPSAHLLADRHRAQATPTRSLCAIRASADGAGNASCLEAGFRR